jgi:hypothetical protein
MNTPTIKNKIQPIQQPIFDFDSFRNDLKAKIEPYSDMLAKLLQDGESYVFLNQGEINHMNEKSLLQAYTSDEDEETILFDTRSSDDTSLSGISRAIENQFANDFTYILSLKDFNNKQKIFDYRKKYAEAIDKVKLNRTKILLGNPKEGKTILEASNAILYFLKNSLDEIDKQIKVNNLINEKELN